MKDSSVFRPILQGSWKTKKHAFFLFYYICISTGSNLSRETLKKDQISHRSCPGAYYPTTATLTVRDIHAADSAESSYSWWKASINTAVALHTNKLSHGDRQGKGTACKGRYCTQLLQNCPSWAARQPQAVLLLIMVQREWHRNTWEPTESCFFLFLFPL